MTEQRIIYRVVSNADVSPNDKHIVVGDIAVFTADADNIPLGWSVVKSLIDFRLEFFDRSKPYPGLVFINEDLTSTRIVLEIGQAWKPELYIERKNVPKLILNINQDEIAYRLVGRGETVFCETESFYEWIIYSKAILIKELATAGNLNNEQIQK